MEMASAKFVVKVDGNTSTACKYCSFYVDSQTFPSGANHYLQIHRMQLLAAGQETVEDYQGRIRSYPFVLLAGDEIPSERPIPKVELVGVQP